MKKLNKQELKKLLFPELRQLARKVGVKPAGKQPADLIREILKKQAKAGGKGTAADPVRPTKRTKKEPRTMPKKAAVSIEDKVDALITVVAEIAESVDVEMPAVLAGKKGKKKAAKDEESDEEEAEDEEADEESDEDADEDEEADEDEDEESDDEEADDDSDEDEEDDADEESDEESDEDEEEDDEEEEPKAKKGKKGKKSSKSDDDEDEDEESEEEVTITSEELEEADIDRLKEIGEAVNESTGEETIDTSIKSARVLRKHIKEALERVADTEEEATPKKGAKPPAWIKKGVKAKAKYEGEWYKVRIEKIGKTHASCFFLDDESDADVVFADLRPLKK